MTIEDAAELRLRQPHVLRLESRPPNLEGRGEVTIRRLVRNALRMRPDRIVVGEVRGPEALDMLTALSTGHDGSLCTVHAGSAAEALRRLETLALMADVGLPHAAIREQVADAIDLVVCQARAADGSRRVTAVAEVVRVAGGAAAREIYTLRAGRPTWRAPLGDDLAARLARGEDGRRADRRAPVSNAALLAAAAAVRRRPRRRGSASRRPRARGSPTGSRSRWRPLARARREGRAPSGAERRRLALLAAGSLLAGGWLARRAAPRRGGGARRPGGGARASSARGARRYREEVRRGAAAAARALADAIGAGHSIRGALAETAPALPARRVTSCGSRRARSTSASRRRPCWSGCACARAAAPGTR